MLQTHTPPLALPPSLRRMPVPGEWECPGASRIYRPTRRPPTPRIIVPDLVPIPLLATSFSLVNKVGGTWGSGGGTTGSISTSGADLIVIHVSFYDATTVNPTVGDNKGNIYTRRTEQLNGTGKSDMYSCWHPTVGAGHTFSVTGSNFFPSVHVLAFSGSKTASEAFERKNEAGTSSPGTSTSTGSVTPDELSELLVAGFCNDDPTIISSLAISGFTIELQDNYVAGVNLGGAVAWTELATPTATSGTWTWTTSITAGANICAFKSDAGPPVASGFPALTVAL